MSVVLSQPVKDIKGKELVPAGTNVLEWSKKAALTGEYLKKKVKFKDSPQVMDDLLSVFEMDPYKKALEGWTPSFREWLGELWAPAVIFDELKLQRLRDPYAYRHVLVIAVVGSRLLEYWIKSPPTVKKTFLALLCHDLGKTRLAPMLLEKSEALLEAEMQSIKEHPLASFVLNAFYWGEVNHMCAEVGLQHQEDRLGTGYPQGSKTNSLVLDILTLLDRFDAMTSERPFRFKKFSVREAFDLIKADCDAGKIEPDVLRVFISLVRKEKVKDPKKIKLGTIGRPPKVSA